MKRVEKKVENDFHRIIHLRLVCSVQLTFNKDKVRKRLSAYHEFDSLLDQINFGN